MKKLPVALAVVAVVLAASACGGGHRVSEAQGRPKISVTSRIVARTVSSSRLILGGRVRCTATLTSPVAAGQRIRNTFTFHNLSSRPVGVYLGGGSLALRAADGTIYDTTLPRNFAGGPSAMPTKVRPGATKASRVATPRVRWSGPLRITPRCYGKALPTVWVRVTSPGPPPSERAAVADVVSASGFLLRHCRPSVPGVPVGGEIEAPDASAPAMPAKCSVTIRRERGFFDAQALVVTPPGQRARVRRPYEQLVPPTRRTGPFEAVAWEFVVTRDGAQSAAAETVDSDDYFAHRRAPIWTWTGSRWKSAGTDPCGAETVYGGFGVGADPTVEFISGCPF